MSQPHRSSPFPANNEQNEQNNNLGPQQANNSNGTSRGLRGPRGPPARRVAGQRVSHRNRKRYTATRRGEVAKVRKEGACDSCKKRKVGCRKGEWGVSSSLSIGPAQLTGQCLYAIQRIQSFPINQHVPSNAGLGSQFNTHIHAPHNMNDFSYSTTTLPSAPPNAYTVPNQHIPPQQPLMEYLYNGDVEQSGRIALGGVGSRTEEGSRDRMSPKLEDLVKTIDGTEHSVINLGNINSQDVPSISFGSQNHFPGTDSGNDRIAQHQQWGVHPANSPGQVTGGESVPPFNQSSYIYSYSNTPTGALYLPPNYNATIRQHSSIEAVPSAPFQVRTVERTNSWERSVQLHPNYPLNAGSPYAANAIDMTPSPTNINAVPGYATTSQLPQSSPPTYDMYNRHSIQDHFYPSPTVHTTPYLQAPPRHTSFSSHHDGSIHSPINHPSNASDQLLSPGGIDISGTPSLAVDQASLSGMSRLEIQSNHGEHVSQQTRPDVTNFDFTDALENWSPTEFELETPPILKGFDPSAMPSAYDHEPFMR